MKHTSRQSYINQPQIIKINPWLISTVVLFFLCIGVFFYFRQEQKQNSSQFQPALGGTKATLTGKITWSGLKPKPGDKGKISLMIRPAGSSENFRDAGITISLLDDSWTYQQATQGENYEVYAALSINGVVISQSAIETVSAPALNIPTDFKVSWEDLGLDPGSLTEDLKTINGRYIINGYLPTGSHLYIEQTVANKTTRIATLALRDSSDTFQLMNLDPRTNYIFQAVLADKNNQIIGRSESIITGQLNNQQISLVINSTATPATPKPQVTVTPIPTPTPTPTPKPTSTPNVGGAVILPPEYAYQQPSVPTNVSGWITINGPLERDSRVLIMGKRPEDSEYRPWITINNPKNDGQFWSYPHAQTGQWYVIKATLQVREQDVNSSSQTTIAAPAGNINFTLNTNFSLQAPAEDKLVNVEPCQRQDDRWFTYLSIPKIEAAGQYWIKVGDQPGTGNFYNQKINLGEGQLRTKVENLTSGRKYVQFSYSLCRDCASESNFSAWSKPISFDCH